MKEILFSLGSVEIYTFGIFICLSFFLGFLLTIKLAHLEKIDNYFIFDLCLASFLSALIVSKISFLLVYYSQLSSLSFVNAFLTSGFVFYPGLLTGILVWSLVVKSKKLDIKKWLDIGMVAFLFALTLAKIGNFLTTNVYGKISSLPFAVSNQHPVSIYEALIYLTGAILLYLYRDKIKQGGIFILGLLILAISDFVFGFLKISIINLGPFSLSQLFSLILIIFLATAYLFPKAKRFWRRRNNVG